MPTRTAEAVWKGNLKEGSGSVKTESGAVEGSYSFPSRFESGKGTNPEELLGASHAACYSMALSNALAEAGPRAGERHHHRQSPSGHARWTGHQKNRPPDRGQSAGVGRVHFSRARQASQRELPYLESPEGGRNQFGRQAALVSATSEPSDKPRQRFLCGAFSWPVAVGSRLCETFFCSLRFCLSAAPLEPLPKPLPNPPRQASRQARFRPSSQSWSRL